MKFHKRESMADLMSKCHSCEYKEKSVYEFPCIGCIYNVAYSSFVRPHDSWKAKANNNG